MYSLALETYISFLAGEKNRSGVLDFLFFRACFCVSRFVCRLCGCAFVCVPLPRPRLSLVSFFISTLTRLVLGILEIIIFGLEGQTASFLERRRRGEVLAIFDISISVHEEFGVLTWSRFACNERQEIENSTQVYIGRTLFALLGCLFAL